MGHADDIQKRETQFQRLADFANKKADLASSKPSRNPRIFSKSTAYKGCNSPNKDSIHHSQPGEGYTCVAKKVNISHRTEPLWIFN
jgi:hypothetical protein